MSTMISFFAAPPAEVQTRKLSDGVPAAFPSVMCDYLDELKLAILESLLTGKDPGACLKALRSQTVYSHDESGIEVFRLGDDLVRALSTLTIGSPVEPAKQWMGIGDWGRFGRRAGDLRDLVDVLTAIGKLASIAVTSPTHGLFLWVCP